MEAIERSVTLERQKDSSVERKKDSFLDLYERLKALNSPLKNEREFEPHHRSSSTKTMTDNWHINNNRKDETGLQTLKANDIRVDRKIDPLTERVTRIESDRNIVNEDKERDKIKKGMVKETLEKFERPNSENKEVIRRKLDIRVSTC